MAQNDTYGPNEKNKAAPEQGYLVAQQSMENPASSQSPLFQDFCAIPSNSYNDSDSQSQANSNSEQTQDLYSTAVPRVSGDYFVSTQAWDPMAGYIHHLYTNPSAEYEVEGVSATAVASGIGPNALSTLGSPWRSTYASSTDSFRYGPKSSYRDHNDDTTYHRTHTGRTGSHESFGIQGSAGRKVEQRQMKSSSPTRKKEMSQHDKVDTNKDHVEGQYLLPSSWMPQAASEPDKLSPEDNVNHDTAHAPRKGSFKSITLPAVGAQFDTVAKAFGETPATKIYEHSGLVVLCTLLTQNDLMLSIFKKMPQTTLTERYETMVHDCLVQFSENLQAELRTPFALNVAEAARKYPQQVAGFLKRKFEITANFNHKSIKTIDDEDFRGLSFAVRDLNVDSNSILLSILPTVAFNVLKEELDLHLHPDPITKALLEVGPMTQEGPCRWLSRTTYSTRQLILTT